MRRQRYNTHGGKTPTYSIVCDQINSGDLLEALHDDAQECSAEVLGPAVGEDLAERRGVATTVRLGRDGFPNADVRLLHSRIRMRLPVERGDDSESFSVTPMLGQPSGGLRQLQGEMSDWKMQM